MFLLVRSLIAFLPYELFVAGSEVYFIINMYVNVSFSVAANLRKAIDDPPSSKSMTFPLVSIFACFRLQTFL